MPGYQIVYLVQNRCNFEYLSNCFRISLIKLLRVEFDASLDGKVIDNGPHKLHSVLLFVDVVGNVALGVVLLGEPVEDIGH